MSDTLLGISIYRIKWQIFIKTVISGDYIISQKKEQINVHS